jgi:glycosyltransferase involved in cell wall biosynthesis
MKRVLFTVRVLDSGGVVTHLMALGTALQDRGWEVAVASSGPAGTHSHGPAWFESNGIRHFDVEFLRNNLAPGNIAAGSLAVRTFASVVREYRPDMMHVHFRATSPYVRVAQALNNIPFVSTLHLESIPSGLLHRRGTFWGDHAIAISRETKATLVSGFKVPPERVSTIPYGVDANWFRPPTPHERAQARATLGLDINATVIAVIARLEAVKRHDVFIDGFERMASARPEVVAILAGEGSLEKSLRARVSSAGLEDRVKFIGYAESRTVLWAADALALTSSKEGFPMVIIEAMMCGVVPVRTPAAGYADQIRDGVDGYIVPFDDDSALAHRLVLLVDEPSRRAVMGRAAAVRASTEFTVDKMVDRTIGVYQAASRTRSNQRWRRR